MVGSTGSRSPVPRRHRRHRPRSGVGHGGRSGPSSCRHRVGLFLDGRQSRRSGRTGLCQNGARAVRFSVGAAARTALHRHRGRSTLGREALRRPSRIRPHSARFHRHLALPIPPGNVGSWIDGNVGAHARTRTRLRALRRAGQLADSVALAGRPPRQRDRAREYLHLHRSLGRLAQRRDPRLQRTLHNRHFDRRRLDDHGRNGVGVMVGARCLRAPGSGAAHPHGLPRADRRTPARAEDRRRAPRSQPYVPRGRLSPHREPRQTDSLRRGGRLCEPSAVQTTDDANARHPHFIFRRPAHDPQGAEERRTGARRGRDRLHLPRRTNHPHRDALAVPARLRADRQRSAGAHHPRSSGPRLGQYLQLRRRALLDESARPHPLPGHRVVRNAAPVRYPGP